MTRTWNIVIQLVALAGQVVNQFGSLIPPARRDAVAAGLAIAQGIVAVVAHSYNPDGTSAGVAYQRPAK